MIAFVTKDCSSLKLAQVELPITVPTGCGPTVPFWVEFVVELVVEFVVELFIIVLLFVVVLLVELFCGL